MYIFWRHGFPFRGRELPDQNLALESGLLAYGGEYSGACFLKAYLRGIFPWPNEETDAAGVIPWFCPRERFVLNPEDLHISHSLKQTLKKHEYRICADLAFSEVIHSCSMKHKSDGTWITEGMEKAFNELHEMGIAHSVECYRGEELVGGFYGTHLGSTFGGESMFMREANATKVAFAVFVKRAHSRGIETIDCQCYTDNMSRYGAKEIPRSEYLNRLEQGLTKGPDKEFWSGEWEY